MNPPTKEEALKMNVDCFLHQALAMVSDDYREDVIRGIIDDVIDDVATSSGYADNEPYNDDDIALALGRVLTSRMGIDR